MLTDGHALQSGVKAGVFAHPASPQVARLLGYRNLTPGLVRRSGEVQLGDSLVAMDTGPLSAGSEVLWSIRPEQVSLVDDGPYAATVVDTADLGSVTEVVLRLGDAIELEMRIPGALDLAAGASCRVALPPTAIRVWPARAAAAAPGS